MGKNELNYFLKEVIDSALEFVDEIVYIDTGSTDGTVDWIKKNYPDIILGYKEFKNHQDYTTIKNYAVSKATCDYVLNTDCDEVFTENIRNLKEILKANPDIEIWSLMGEHFMGDLVHLDRTLHEHIWQNRLYKRISSIKYPESCMHGLPEGFKTSGLIKGISIFHYGFCKNMCDALRRYETNLNDPTQNREEFLTWQLYKMITGTYPGQATETYRPQYYLNRLLSHPFEIREKFHINKIIDFVKHG